MASTSALFTALSGLNAHSQALDVIGNNIANANTTAFKSSRVVFEPLFSRTLGGGTAPSTASGGTNPTQIGLGVKVGGTQRDLRNGSISATGDSRDLAIEGKGYFIVGRGSDMFYTRDGGFRTNSANELVTNLGDRVQGYGVDANFNVQPGQLVDMVIPVGTLTIAEATTNVRFAGNLNADGQVSTAGSFINLLGDDMGNGFSLIAGATVPPTVPNVLEDTSLLTEIEDPDLPASGTTLFLAGQRLTVDGAEKGTKILPAASFDIQATSTMADLMAFLTNALGLNTTVGANPDGSTPGVALNASTGVLTITGNVGEANDLVITDTDIQLFNADGSAAAPPFFTDKTGQATGESVKTTFVTYDSLGTALTVDLTMALESRSDAGTTWRYFVESADHTDPNAQIESGTLSFDVNGQLATLTPVTVRLARAGTGAETPLQFDMVFRGDRDGVTALTDVDSEMAAIFQDGAPLGTLTDYSVGSDGTITGSFSNAVTRTLGQVAMASFTNAHGLVDQGSNLFRVGPNSGPPIVTAPGGLGTGRVVGGALELSNVDLGQEFINLILTSTGYSASSRVVRTADELLQQLLVLGR